MRVPSRLLLSGAVAGSLLVGFAFAASHYATRLGLDFWSWPELLKRVELAEKRAQELNVRLATIQDRLRSREQVLAALADQRLTLFQAAAYFREINRTHTAAERQMVDESYPGGSEEEKLCRFVIALLRIHLSEQSQTGDALAAKLEALLNDQLAQGGRILLPELPRSSAVPRAAAENS